MEDDDEINSKFVIDGSIREYMYMVFGFSQKEELDHDVILALGFFSNEEGDLVQVVLVSIGLKVHERDSHVHRLLVLYGLFPITQDWYSKIKELTFAYFYLYDFDGCDTLVLILYRDVINFK